MIGALAACAFLVSLLAVRDHRQSAILAAAFTIRIVVIIAHMAGITLPDSQFDARTFERIAWLWARDGRLFDDFTTGSYLYSWLSSGVYLLFGRDPFLLHVINASFGTLTIYLVMRSARRLSPDTRLDSSVGWILAFYPSVVLYSVLTLREAPIVLALSISIHLLVSWVNTRRIAFGLGAVFFIALAQLFHAGMIGGTVAILFIYSRTSLQSVSIRDNLRPLVLIAVLIAVAGTLVFSLRTGVGLEKVWLFMSSFNLDFVSLWQSNTAKGRTAYLTGVELHAWSDLIWNVPLRVLYFLGTPFVWMVGGLQDTLGLLDALVFLYVTSRIILDVAKRRVLTVDAYLAIALVIIGVLGLFAIATSNYGTAVRHRAKIFPWLLLLYLYGTTLRAPTLIGLRYRNRRRSNDSKSAGRQATR